MIEATPETPRIGLILNHVSRGPLEAVLIEAGYDVFTVSDNSLVEMMVASNRMSAWVFDAHDDDLYELLQKTGKFLQPADNPPIDIDGNIFAAWSQGIVQQLNRSFDSDFRRPNALAEASYWSNVRSVWVLAASAGGIAAVEEFLNTFRSAPPVAFIYAQHFDPEKQDQLDNLVSGNVAFKFAVNKGRHYLAPGRIVIVPPRCKITISSLGEVTSSREDWGDQHTPDINELLYHVAAAKLPEPGVIFFSGMSDDGSESLKVLNASKVRIWAQAPSSAVCNSMPQAAIDTGYVEFTGSPVELAQRLMRIHQNEAV